MTARPRASQAQRLLRQLEDCADAVGEVIDRPLGVGAAKPIRSLEQVISAYAWVHANSTVPHRIMPGMRRIGCRKLAANGILTGRAATRDRSVCHRGGG